MNLSSGEKPIQNDKTKGEKTNMTLQAERTTKPVRRREGSTRMAIYDYIVSFSNQYGFPPTIREIGEAMGLSSSGTVSAHLRRLEQDHMIERYANHARAIRPRAM